MDNNNFDIKNEVKQESNGGSQDQGMKRSYNDMGNDRDDMPQKRFRRGGNDRRNNDGRCELRCLVPSRTAGGVIGKGGANIKDMRNTFNASIQIPDASAPERVLQIKATPESCGEIILRVLPIVNQDRDGGRGRGDRRGGNKDGELSLKVLVHQSQAGAIIGSKGFQIKELREKTGAVIKVERDCAGGSTDRICLLAGAPEKISKCLVMILEILEKAPPKGPVQNYDPGLDGGMGGQGGMRGGPPMDGQGRRGQMGGRGGRFQGGMGRDNNRDRSGRGGRDFGGNNRQGNNFRQGGGRGNFDDEEMGGGRDFRGGRDNGRGQRDNGRDFGGNRNFGGNRDFGGDRDMGNNRDFGGNRNMGGNRDFGGNGRDFGGNNRDFGNNRDMGGKGNRNNGGGDFQGRGGRGGGRGGMQAQGSRNRPQGGQNRDRSQGGFNRQGGNGYQGFNKNHNQGFGGNQGGYDDYNQGGNQGFGNNNFNDDFDSGNGNFNNGGQQGYGY